MAVKTDTKKKSIVDILGNPHTQEMQNKQNKLDPKSNIVLKKDEFFAKIEERESLKSEEESVRLHVFRKLDAEGTKLIYELGVSLTKLQILSNLEGINYLEGKDRKEACGLLNKLQKLNDKIKCSKTASEVEVEYSIEINNKTMCREGEIAVIMTIEDLFKELEKIDDPDISAVLPKMRYLIFKYKLKL